MGTHPIFESDFDCLTERKREFVKGAKVVTMRFLGYVMVSATTIWVYHMWTKLKYERVNCKLTWRKAMTTVIILFVLGKLCDFKPNKFFRFLTKSDEEIAEGYGYMREKYIQAMGFDNYDFDPATDNNSEEHADFAAIGDSVNEDKIKQSDAIPPPSQEVVEHQLHEDVKDDQLPHIKAIEPEEESIELENIAKTNEVENIIHPDMNDPRLPKFIVIGVMKCGTGATQHFLHNHPDLAQAKQETYFFNNDHKYKGKGFEYYLSLYEYPKTPNVLNYEKTPTYYKSIRAQSRIQAMNSTIKLVNIVCDNVRRTMSRFLHIQHGVAIKKFTPSKLQGLGHTLDSFNDNLRKTIKNMGAFLEEVKQTEGGGTMEGLVEALHKRYKTRQRPFGISATKDPIELIISDGFYAVFHKRWQEFFPDDQLKVIDGNRFLTEAWVPLKVLQNFIGVQEYIGKKNFVLPPGGKGLPCFTEEPSNAAKTDCLGEGKGRTMDKRFSKDVNDALPALFKPLDDYFAKKILHRKPFKWDFGQDEL